jgi:hypothetical protein
VNLDEPYYVFLQVYGGATIYVSERTDEQFEVRLREGGNAKGAKGDPDTTFSYIVWWPGGWGTNASGWSEHPGPMTIRTCIPRSGRSGRCRRNWLSDAFRNLTYRPFWCML